MKHTIRGSFLVSTQVRADHVADNTQLKEPRIRYGTPCADDRGVINALEVA